MHLSHVISAGFCERKVTNNSTPNHAGVLVDIRLDTTVTAQCDLISSYLFCSIFAVEMIGVLLMISISIRNFDFIIQ